LLGLKEQNVYGNTCRKKEANIRWPHLLVFNMFDARKTEFIAELTRNKEKKPV
jgi:hypothetical protein